LADPRIKPGPQEIAFVRESFLDLLRIRASTTLFRMRTAEDVRQRLRFHNTGPGQNPLVIVGELDGRGYPGAAFESVLYLVNVSPQAQEVRVESPPGRSWRLHPVLRGKDWPAPYHDGGRFRVPGRTAVVYVADSHPTRFNPAFLPPLLEPPPVHRDTLYLVQIHVFQATHVDRRGLGPVRHAAQPEGLAPAHAAEPVLDDVFVEG